MKICVISFDFWDYDHYIVKALRDHGVDAHHIKIGAVSHSNFSEKLINAGSKLLVRKNLKNEKRQKYVVNTLEKLGFQDQILVLNPDVFTDETLVVIRKYTNRLITFLYDNLARYPVQEKLHFFDKIFSFDNDDVQKYQFEKLCNYNYLNEHQVKSSIAKYDIFYITSFDKRRNKIILSLINKLDELTLNYRIFIVGKKIWKLKLERLFSRKNKFQSVVFRKKIIDPKETIRSYEDSTAILDLMRAGQSGLSFRIFEAMALRKKIVTDNPTIKDYNFFNPQNILVLNEDLSNLEQEFFNSPYVELPAKIYEQYTLKSWVVKVFNLNIQH